MIDSLINAARKAQKNAYVPYSGYPVGAAILDSTGNLWSGCNVENVSYGLSVCAERTAICKMVSEGVREIQSIAVVTRDGGTPCGMCLQTLLEFAVDPKSVEVITVSDSGEVKGYSLSDLIPHGFSSIEFKRT
jgi:cytidine deaminase